MLQDERVQLRILHTNDIHSRFGQMPKLASAVQTLRQEAGEHRTLLLDIGDHVDRMFVETEGTRGEANIAVMNAMKYDAATIGNNEGLTLSKEELDRLYGELAGFPVTAGNLPLHNTASGWPRPCACIERNGLRIALIGVTAYFQEFYELLGWDIEEPLAVVERMVKQWRADADIIIVLSHLGLKKDKLMASTIDGIDLILGGHTHHVLEKPLRVRQTYVCGAGKYGQYVGRVDIEFDRLSGRIAALDGGLHEADHYPPSTEVAALIDHYNDQAREHLNIMMLTLQEELDLNWAAESRLGNVLASGIKHWTGADIALVNAGQLLQGLPAGPVTAEQLLRICPSPINCCRMTLTGEQLLLALEESLLSEFITKPLFGFGFRGKELGTLCVDGLRIEYDPDGKPLNKIKRVLTGAGGKAEELVPSRKYTVGTIDMFTFGIGYHSISEGADVEYLLPFFLREVLARELSEEGSIADSLRKRWVPTNNFTH